MSALTQFEMQAAAHEGELQALFESDPDYFRIVMGELGERAPGGSWRLGAHGIIAP